MSIIEKIEEKRAELGQNKPKTAKTKGIKWAKFKEEVKKLAVAVVIAEYLVAGAWLGLEKYGILDFLRPKTVIIQVAQAKTEAPKVEEKQEEPKNTIESAEQLADYIHFKESTRGTAPNGLHKTCQAKGLSNEYGYNPPKCYASNEQVRNIVIDWIERHRAEGLTDDELLKHYSKGAYGVN